MFALLRKHGHGKMMKCILFRQKFRVIWGLHHAFDGTLLHKKILSMTIPSQSTRIPKPFRSLPTKLLQSPKRDASAIFYDDAQGWTGLFSHSLHCACFYACPRTSASGA